MKFTFDYEETLTRRVIIEANTLMDAIEELGCKIDAEEIVLGAEDFAGGTIKMPLECNHLPRLELFGEPVENKDGLSIVIDCW